MEVVHIWVSLLIDPEGKGLTSTHLWVGPEGSTHTGQIGSRLRGKTDDWCGEVGDGTS